MPPNPDEFDPQEFPANANGVVAVFKHLEKLTAEINAECMRLAAKYQGKP
jgi:hypothetical protein